MEGVRAKKGSDNKSSAERVCEERGMTLCPWYSIEMGGLQEEKDVWGWTKYGDEIVATKRERYWYEDKWVTDYMNTKTKKNTDENDFRAGSFCCTEDLRCPTDPDHVRYKAMGSGRKWWEVSHTPVQLYRLEPELKRKYTERGRFQRIYRDKFRDQLSYLEKDPSRPVSDAKLVKTLNG